MDFYLIKDLCEYFEWIVFYSTIFYYIIGKKKFIIVIIWENLINIIFRVKLLNFSHDNYFRFDSLRF